MMRRMLDQVMLALIEREERLEALLASLPGIDETAEQTIQRIEWLDARFDTRNAIHKTYDLIKTLFQERARRFTCLQCGASTEYPTLHVDKGVPRYFCGIDCFEAFVVTYEWDGPFVLTSLAPWQPMPIEDVPF
jgi:hypothetical protein